MEYLNKLISKWMPSDSKRVAVDSHPRLSGIMDTINATLAHGPATRLPSEFYDEKGRAIIDKIGVEEWFSGYRESTEYRTVGIGGLVGDIVSRMVGNVEHKGNDGVLELGGTNGSVGQGRGGEKRIKFAMSGCHDTTLAAVMTSLGAFEGEKWPPYTSHIAVELFKKTTPLSKTQVDSGSNVNVNQAEKPSTQKASFWSSLFGSSQSKALSSTSVTQSIARKPIHELGPEDRQKLDDYYVRIRYNDRPMVVPGCKLPGNHLNGDDSFCTLVRFSPV